MRVFVLSPGRSGSLTFARACAHIENFTAEHESRRNLRLNDRLDYPDDHIEADNRLTWFLGGLAERYPDAFYVHLLRDRDATAKSLLRRWTVHPPRHGRPRNPLRRWYRQARERHPGNRILHAFAYSMIGRTNPWPEAERYGVCTDYIDTVRSNVSHFLVAKNAMVFHLEHAASDFPTFWDRIGATGDLDAALAEFSHHYDSATVES